MAILKARVLALSLLMPSLWTVHAHAADVPVRADIPNGILLGVVKIDSSNGQSMVFTNASNLPLYYNESADAGACDSECEKTWLPVLAMAGMKPVDAWTIATRPDNTKQWVYRGKPVYTYVKDRPSGESKYPLETYRYVSNPGQSVPSAAGNGLDGKWRVVTASWGDAFEKPTSISVEEHILAQAQVLTSWRRAALYAFDGNRAAAAKLSTEWLPLAAGLSELPVGEFSIVERDDGVRQWAYRKLPLFSFKRDLAPEDLNGKGVVKGMEPAIVAQYFVPADAAVVTDRPGGRLVQSTTGKSLYVRERLDWTQIRLVSRGNPQIGRSIGISGCDAACEMEWKPFLAPVSAQPGAYWNVIARPDGAKHWTYKGYALYTKADEPPGVVFNDETYNVHMNHSTDERRPAFEGIGLYWRVAEP